MYMLKKTMGAIITAQPKLSDYEKSANALSKLIYKKITSGQYGLNRSMKDSNDYPSSDRINATTIAVSLKTEDLSGEELEDLLSVSQSFTANNMNSDKLSTETIKALVTLDKEKEGLFSDVSVVVGYKYDTDDEDTPLMLLSKVDDVVKNIQNLSATISVTTYETEKEFLSAYNSETNSAKTYGNVGSFTFA